MPSILYNSDVSKYHPYYQTDTTNQSFIRMCLVLKRMGIQNNKFMLTLFQPELAKVNPFDYDNLDIATTTKIAWEAKNNPWYFFRELLRFPMPGGETIPFQLHRGNLAAIWTFFNDIDFGLIQPRQTGKTYVTQSLVCYYMYILASNVQIGMFTKDTNLLQDNVRRLKEMKEGLPTYLLKPSAADTDRKEGLSYAFLHNAYKTFTAAVDEKGAYNLGR